MKIFLSLVPFLFLLGCSDPNEEANKLLVEAANLVGQSATYGVQIGENDIYNDVYYSDSLRGMGPKECIKAALLTATDLAKAKEKVERIMTDFPTSNAAVKVATEGKSFVSAITINDLDIKLECLLFYFNIAVQRDLDVNASEYTKHHQDAVKEILDEHGSSFLDWLKRWEESRNP